MAEDSEFVRIIREANPHLAKEDILTFGVPEKTEINFEVDNTALEWWFKERSYNVTRALRIPYRYVRRSGGELTLPITF
jgi:hypothetical protein